MRQGEWTDEERAVVQGAFSDELEKLAKQIALGRRMGYKAIASTLWQINQKIRAAKVFGITEAKGFSCSEELEPLARELAVLAEFSSNSPIMQRRIYQRIFIALTGVGVEAEFLKETGRSFSL